MVKQNNTIAERQNKEKTLLLENLKKMPIVTVACERSHIARATFYRWRIDSAKFRKLADNAIEEGEALLVDMTESQLLSLIRTDKHFPAISLYLKTHHPKYKTTTNRSRQDDSIKKTGILELIKSLDAEDGSYNDSD